MREGIGLSRGKRKDNGEWIYGFYYQQPNPRTKDGLPIYHGISDFPPFGAEVIPETVGQYIGKTDKNRKKIFEGDIGRYKQTDGAKRNGKPIICMGKVIYNEVTASYAVESKDEEGCKYFDYFPIKDFEIVGNCIDNPELLQNT